MNDFKPFQIIESCLINQRKGWQSISLKGQIIRISGFVYHTRSLLWPTSSSLQTI